jgi:hypothetical protein
LDPLACIGITEANNENNQSAQEIDNTYSFIVIWPLSDVALPETKSIAASTRLLKIIFRSGSEDMT